MSKAAKYSFNIPSKLFQQLTKEQQVLWRKEIESAFNNGYHQAEEDLELSWEDIKEICVQSVLVEIDLGGLVSDERHYTEVLKRFKERK